MSSSYLGAGFIVGAIQRISEARPMIEELEGGLNEELQEQMEGRRKGGCGAAGEIEGLDEGIGGLVVVEESVC